MVTHSWSNKFMHQLAAIFAYALAVDTLVTRHDIPWYHLVNMLMLHRTLCVIWTPKWYHLGVQITGRMVHEQTRAHEHLGFGPETQQGSLPAAKW